MAKHLRTDLWIYLWFTDVNSSETRKEGPSPAAAVVSSSGVEILTTSVVQHSESSQPSSVSPLSACVVSPGANHPTNRPNINEPAKRNRPTARVTPNRHSHGRPREGSGTESEGSSSEKPFIKNEAVARRRMQRQRKMEERSVLPLASQECLLAALGSMAEGLNSDCIHWLLIKSMARIYRIGLVVLFLSKMRRVETILKASLWWITCTPQIRSHISWNGIAVWMNTVIPVEMWMGSSLDYVWTGNAILRSFHLLDASHLHAFKRKPLLIIAHTESMSHKVSVHQMRVVCNAFKQKALSEQNSEPPSRPSDIIHLHCIWM